MSRPAIFLDRDGVINVDKGYTYKPEDLQFTSQAGQALAQLKAAGYLLIVITNQSGVARGFYQMANVDEFHQAMQAALLKSDNLSLDAFYVCPHHVDGKIPELSIACQCRKPGIANVEKAVKEHDVQLDGSYFIGDKKSDVECGKNLGIKTIHITDQPQSVHPAATATAPTLSAAVQIILNN